MTTALRYRDASKLDRAKSACMAGTLLCFAVWLGEANAYQLSPEGTPEERALSGIKRSWARSAAVTSSNLYVRYFNEAVHEEVTNRIYGCEGGSDICGGMSPSRVPPGVLAGVRWNDDPPFMITPKAARLTTCKTTETIRFQTVTDRVNGATDDRRNGATCRPLKTGLERGRISGLFGLVGNRCFRGIGGWSGSAVARAVEDDLVGAVA